MDPESRRRQQMLQARHMQALRAQERVRDAQAARELQWAVSKQVGASPVDPRMAQANFLYLTHLREQRRKS